MNIFGWISEIFKPAADLVDELHFSDEEAGNIEIAKKKIDTTQMKLKNELAKMQHDFATKAMELQSKALEANMQVAIAEQQNGSKLSKNWRPVCSILCMVMLTLMGLEIVAFNKFLATIYGSFLGIFVPLRSFVDKKKNPNA